MSLSVIRMQKLLSGLLLTLLMSAASATSIVISNLDGANEGFNDTTAASPVGGNPGTTLGEQRLRVFEHAAKIWQAVINSRITIVVNAHFDPLTCTSTQAVLGSAGATTSYRDFPNAPVASTWYVVALANSLSGSDLNSTSSEISATFNSDIDNNNNCLNNTNWYYGLDGIRPAGTVELLSVVMHEIGHGLGFQSLVNLSTGARALGLDDAYMLNLEDHSLGLNWNQMTDAQRLTSITDAPDLHWTGANVTAQVANYTSGIDQGHARMYAPNPAEGGSSISHFSKALTPNELMEPVDTGPKSGPGLALPLFMDLGWPVFADASPVIAVLGNQATQDGQTIQVSVLINDNDTPLANLTLSALSSNTAIVDAAGMSFSGSGNQRTLSVTPLVGSSGTVTITVTVADAGSNASEAFDLVVTTNNPPVINVTSPADAAGFLDTDTVNLTASASDAEDGDVSASLAWSSSIDGALGSGPALAVQLTEGTHTLTVTAVDSGGKQDTVNLTVFSYGSGDSDTDGLSDNWEFLHFGTLNETAAGDTDTDGLTNLEEFNQGTIPTNPDSDGDGVTDGDEVNLYGLDPTLSNTGDIAPRGGPDGLINAGDLVVMSRLVTGILTPPSTLESILADINNDSQLNAADLLLLEKAVLNGTSP